MANFGHFAGFSKLSPKNETQGVTWNDQFHPIQNWWKLLPPKYLIFAEISKNLIPGGGVAHQQFVLSFSTFSNHFTLKWLKMTHNGEFCQNKWLRLAQNGQFWSFCRFFHLFPLKSGSDWLRMTNFTRFTTFPIFLPPKCLIFGEISKFFCSWGGTLAIFWSF